jgi:hypothetical protein
VRGQHGHDAQPSAGRIPQTEIAVRPDARRGACPEDPRKIAGYVDEHERKFMPLADIRRSLAAQVGGDLCRQKVISRHKSTRHKSPQQDSTLEEPQQKALPAFVVLGGSSRPNFVGMKNYQGTRFQEDATLRPNLTRVCEHSSLYALPRHCPDSDLRALVSWWFVSPL